MNNDKKIILFLIVLCIALSFIFFVLVSPEGFSKDVYYNESSYNCEKTCYNNESYCTERLHFSYHGCLKFTKRTGVE